MSPANAYAQCFEQEPPTSAVLVPMVDVVAGDTVLSDKHTSAQIIANQHRQAQHAKTTLLTLHHSSGKLTVTPDHVVFCDGRFMAAREVKLGSKLDGQEVDAITSSAGGVVNAVTTTGTILAAGGVGGLPIMVTTSGEGLSDVMLSGYPSFSASVLFAQAFPSGHMV